MSERKQLNQLVRARMSQAGESYSTARRQVIRQAPDNFPAHDAPAHLPGSIPVCTALRVLLRYAGVMNPRTKAPFSEAMVFGIDGGIGAGMFSFHYAKENFSSFFVAGRHGWQDDAHWTAGARKRLGVKAVVKESSGVKPAEKQLRGLLGGGRPVMAWVDSTLLPHRAMPGAWSGGGYHAITVHRIDDAAGIAMIGDLADEPIPIPLPALAASRDRIKKFKNRVLALEPGGKVPELAPLIHASIQACVDGLLTGKMKNFRLDAFKSWADKLDGSKAADSWEKIFPPGPLLYTGLRSITEFIEYTGTGGGLCRPVFSEFLEEASSEGGGRELAAVAERYAELGRGWTALAEAALPDEVPAFRQVKRLLARRFELISEGGSGGEELRACRADLGQCEAKFKQTFPLDTAQSAELRRALQARVSALYQQEVAALEALQAWVVRAGGG
jgi:hypothetical protein